MLEVIGVKNIGKLIPNADDKKPKDPVSENMDIINGKPTKAFIYQDHQAHLAVHMAAMQDPKLMQMMSQNPMAQQMQAAALAHINEHIAFEYRKQIEEQLGAELPKPGENLPEDVELELSRLTAAAAQKLLAKDQAEMQQQQAQQQQQDPLVQMQQQELQLKAQDLQIKAQKTQADIQLDQAKLELEKEKLASHERLEGIKVGSKTTLDKNRLEGEQLIQGARLGMDAEFKKQEHSHKEKETAINAVDRLMEHKHKVENRNLSKEQTQPKE
jgi:hypothetical protein